MSDADDLARALRVVRERITDARRATFTTSDGSLSGFVLADVEFGDLGVAMADESLDVTVWRDVRAEVDALVEGVAWDGVMRENKHGVATWDVWAVPQVDDVPGRFVDVESMQALADRATGAAGGDSNDDEVAALRDALEDALTRWPEVRFG